MLEISPGVDYFVRWPSFRFFVGELLTQSSADARV